MMYEKPIMRPMIATDGPICLAHPDLVKIPEKTNAAQPSTDWREILGHANKTEPIISPQCYCQCTCTCECTCTCVCMCECTCTCTCECTCPDLRWASSPHYCEYTCSASRCGISNRQGSCSRECPSVSAVSELSEHDIPPPGILQEAFSLSEIFAFRKEKSGGLLFNNKTWEVMILNETAAQIVRLLDGKQTPNMIANELGKFYDVEPSLILQDIENLLALLQRIDSMKS